MYLAMLCSSRPWGDNLEQSLNTSRGKTYEKSFGGPKLGAIFFFQSGLSRTFINHRTAGEGEGTSLTCH